MRPSHTKPAPLPAMSLADAVDRAAGLKARATAITEELRQLNLFIAEKAEYKEGQQTGHAAGAHFIAKVQRRENVKWDQGKLEAVRAEVGDESFWGPFTFEIKPRPARDFTAKLAALPPEAVAAVMAARTATPGAPAVTYEELGE